MEIISREEAREKGLKRYFTGKPCKHGHVSERRVSNNGCCECNKIHMSRRTEEQKKEYSRRYREKHRERLKQDQREYRTTNGDRVRECDRRRSSKPERRLCNAVRSSLISAIKRLKINKTDTMKGTVGYSALDLATDIETKLLHGMSWENHGEWHIDHVYPVVRFLREGVTCPKRVNSMDNLVPMWAEHNIAKSDKTLGEWLSEKGEDSEEYKLYSRFL